MRELYDAGAVWPPATTRSPLAEAAEAHRISEGRHFARQARPSADTAKLIPSGPPRLDFA